MTTKEKIFNKALKFFNKNGIESVGIRELATALDMSPGNLAYHYPKKIDIVRDAVARLGQLNAETMQPFDEPGISLEGFLGRFGIIYHNHVQFRCLVLSSVQISQLYPELGKRYKETQKERNSTIKKGLLQLIQSGYLKKGTDDDALDLLVDNISILSRFWLSAATLADEKKSDDELVNYALRLLAALFRGYVTPKGEKQLKGFCEGLG